MNLSVINTKRVQNSLMEIAIRLFRELGDTPTREWQLRLGMRPRSPAAIYRTFMLHDPAIFGLRPLIDVNLFIFPLDIHKDTSIKLTSIL